MIANQPFRIEPQMRPEAYQTYQILAPVSSHFRPATCEEINCPNYVNGWRVRADVLDEKMIHTATHSGRKFEWVRVSELENWLVFEAGQPCFNSSGHRTRIDKPELFLIRQGDHRGNPRGTEPRRLHVDDWQDDFQNHQDKLATEFERG